MHRHSRGPRAAVSISFSRIAAFTRVACVSLPGPRVRPHQHCPSLPVVLPLRSCFHSLSADVSPVAALNVCLLYQTDSLRAEPSLGLPHAPDAWLRTRPQRKG